MNPIVGASLVVAAAAQASVPSPLALPLVWVTVLVWAMVALLLVSVVGIVSQRERQAAAARYVVGVRPCASRLGLCFGCAC